jgi:hypothetical protein
VWWLVRAAALWLLATRPLGAEWVPDDPFSIASLLVFALVSVQWGRGKWLPTRWLKATRRFLDVVAILAIPFLLAGMNEYVAIAMVRSSASAAYESSTAGLAVEGARVRNIFAYDADGQPIERVQLFDQNGQPLTTVGPSGRNDDWDYYFYGGGGPTPVAEREIGRQPVWNIFPLRELPAPPYTSEVDPDDAVVPAFPFAQVPPLPEPLAGDDLAQADAHASPTPTASPAP